MDGQEHHAGAAATRIQRHPAPDEAQSDEQRLRVLRSFAAEELEDDPQLAALVRFAARLCDVPIAQVTLVESERQLFLAGEGLDMREMPRAQTFCNRAMLGEGAMEIGDATKDDRFAANPLVTGDPFIRFYAGQPLVSEEGAPLGALCLMDTRPREGGLTDLQREGLEVLARAVMSRLTAHRQTMRASREMRQRDEQLRSLADSIPAIAWSAGADGEFEYFNQGLVDFFGEADASGSAFHPEDWGPCNAAWQSSLASGETYEVEHRLRRYDGQYRWMLSRAVPVRDGEGRITRWFGTAVDIDEVHRESETRDLLSKELAHRIKNIFAVVIGLISLESRRRPEHRAFAEDLTQTLRALSRAHEFVRPSGGDTRESLKGLLGVLFAPYGTEEKVRVLVSGTDCATSARAATPLALVFHELATNSGKYGALSADNGHVTLDIADGDDTLQLIWREHGAPPPPPALAPEAQGENTGFGSRLVEMSVTGQLGGSWVRRFEPGGLVVELTISKQAVAS